jgi:protoporphyrinogen oxidase
MKQRANRIAVLGGGIGGLATAHFLLQAGYTPIVFEASDRVGGLGTYFVHAGATLDCFYHVILDSDADLCALVRDLGLGDRFIWRETGMGFHIGGTLYGFNTPLDLLRFRALSLADRLRTGLGALYLTTLKRNGRDLDAMRAFDWLPRVFGDRVFARIWQPLLRAKFGERAESVPAYWVWNLLNREKNGSQEVKGYVRGGYAIIAETLQRSIGFRGGEVRLRSPVNAVELREGGVIVESSGLKESFDAVVSTLPLPVLAKLARGGMRAAIPLPELAYQGVVNAVVLSRQPLERFYWTVVVDPSFPFQGVVETTHVIPREWVGDRHVIYLMNYCAAGSEPYRRSDELVQRQAVDGLRALYPRFNAADVEAVYVFRAPYVEPVWSVGYLQKRPAVRVAESRLYLSTTAQAYPRVTAWNTSVALARETVAALTNDLGHSAAAQATPAVVGRAPHALPSAAQERWIDGHSNSPNPSRI